MADSPRPMQHPHPAPPPRSADRTVLLRRARALGVPADYGHARGLPPVREPQRLSFIGHDVHGRPQWLAPRAATALRRLLRASAAGRVTIDLVSAFRTIEHQLDILERKCARGQSIDEILRVSAAPGYSEHHSGRAVDLTTPGYAQLEEVFEHSPAFAWLQRHAADFGFRMSYPRGNAHGIAYEPWHWCWHAR